MDMWFCEFLWATATDIDNDEIGRGGEIGLPRPLFLSFFIFSFVSLFPFFRAGRGKGKLIANNQRFNKRGLDLQQKGFD